MAPNSAHPSGSGFARHDRHEPCYAPLLQVMMALRRAQHGGKGFRDASVRVTLWLLNDFPARLEALMVPAKAALYRVGIGDDGSSTTNPRHMAISLIWAARRDSA